MEKVKRVTIAKLDSGYTVLVEYVSFDGIEERAFTTYPEVAAYVAMSFGAENEQPN